MRLVLYILLGLFVLLSSYGCRSGKLISANEIVYNEPRYKIIIQYYEYRNTMGKIMDVVNHNKMFITQTDEISLSNEEYELRIGVMNVQYWELSNLERELKQAMNVFCVTIEKS